MDYLLFGTSIGSYASSRRPRIGSCDGRPRRVPESQFHRGPLPQHVDVEPHGARHLVSLGQDLHAHRVVLSFGLLLPVVAVAEDFFPQLYGGRLIASSGHQFVHRDVL